MIMDYSQQQHEQVVVQQHEPAQHWSFAEVVATLAKAKPATSSADVTNLRIGIHLLSLLDVDDASCNTHHLLFSTEAFVRVQGLIFFAHTGSTREVFYMPRRCL